MTQREFMQQYVLNRARGYPGHIEMGDWVDSANTYWAMIEKICNDRERERKKDPREAQYGEL
jgi:hypothetical protein